MTIQWTATIHQKSISMQDNLNGCTTNTQKDGLFMIVDNHALDSQLSIYKFQRNDTIIE